MNMEATFSVLCVSLILIHVSLCIVIVLIQEVGTLDFLSVISLFNEGSSVG